MPSSFEFRAFRSLKAELGELDCYSECIEIAVRQLVDNALKSGSPVTHIQELSRKFGVRVDDIDVASLSVHVCQLYLVTVHQQFERFLADLSNEYGTAKLWSKTSKESWLTSVLRNIGPDVDTAKSRVGELPVLIVEYYRGVRNKFAHHDFDAARFSRTLPRIRMATPASKYAKLSAPNTYNEVTFDDFILFSRAVKDSAVGISKLCQPTPAEIAQMLTEVDDDDFSFVSLKQKKASSRIKIAILASLRHMYGLSEAEGIEVVDILLKGSLA